MSVDPDGGEMAKIIERYGLRLLGNRLEDGKCPDCGVKVDGVGL